MHSGGGVQPDVAVKVLRRDVEPGSQAVQRLKDEGRLLGLLNHPAIVRAHDLILLNGRVALVTDYVEGADLEQCYQADMPFRAMAQVVSEVADALHVAYNTKGPEGRPLRLIHRDIKPANIRIGLHGEVKLLDFGIAWAKNVARSAHTTGVVVGSPVYMAPERLRQLGSNEPPGDIFSLGCTLYDGVVRQRLFHDVSLEQQYGLAMDPEHFATFLEERLALVQVPDVLLELLRALLRYDPTERPSAAEVAATSAEMAESLLGPRLREWCRDRAWPTPEGMPAELVGQTIGEVSLGEIELPSEIAPSSLSIEQPMNETWAGFMEPEPPISAATLEPPAPQEPKGSMSRGFAFLVPALATLGLALTLGALALVFALGWTPWANDGMPVAEEERAETPTTDDLPSAALPAGGPGTSGSAVADADDQVLPPSPTPAPPPTDEDPSGEASAAAAPTVESRPSPEPPRTTPRPPAPPPEEVDAADGDGSEAEEPLPSVRLKINSEAKASEIHIDGEYKGWTPWNGMVSVGLHDIRLTTSDGGQAEKRLEVLTGDVAAEFCWNFAVARECH